MLLRQWVPDDIPHMKWKINFMFESSKQISQICINIYIYIIIYITMENHHV